MIPNSYKDVASQQVSLLPLAIAQVEGYFKGATAARWLQIHDSCTAPVAGAVPLWEIPIYQTSQFFENLQVSALGISEGIFIGVSTTEGTWTASTDTMDVTVWTERAVLAANAVGDKTTALYLKQVWAEAAGGAKKLYALHVTELLGAARYVFIVATNDFTGRWAAMIPIAANETLNLYFGDDGLVPMTAGATTDTAAATGARLGCSVIVSDTVPTVEGDPFSHTPNSSTIMAITN